MVETSRRTPVRGPTFIRLLARFSEGEVAAPDPSLSDRLSHWIDWTRAVALSRALDGAPAAPAVAAPGADTSGIDTSGAGGDHTEAADCARARAALTEAITQDPVFAPAGGGSDAPPLDATGQVGFEAFRKRHLAHQRAIQSSTGRLRGRLRDRLAAQAGDQARLADVDAAMELVLSPREHSLLAAVPDLLEAHFQRLRDAASESSGDSHGDLLGQQTAPIASGAWLDGFRRDLQHALLAELELRFQPIEGLLAALRPH